MMAKLTALLGFLGLCWQVSGEQNKYDKTYKDINNNIVICTGSHRLLDLSGNPEDLSNYTLLKITPCNEQHMEALATLPSISTNPADEVDVFKWSHGLNDSMEVLVSPNNKEKLEDFARRYGMPVELEHNYGRTFNDSVETHISRAGFDKFQYHSYEEITAHLKQLAVSAQNLVQLEEVGKSYEKREILLIKISTNHKAKNPIVFIESCLHAREWVSPSMALYIIHRLTTDYDARYRELNGVDWYIIPVANPDGYEYSRTGGYNRMWRKTRSPTVRKDCPGVDLNRNFDYQWGVSGVSSNPCSQVFCGLKPFSEVEAQTIRDVTAKEKGRIKLYVSVHTYGNYLIYPWGYTKSVKVEKWKRLHNLAVMASDALQKAGGRPFRVMSAGEWDPAAGASDDYAYGANAVPYSYTMELTDGFQFTFPSSLLKTILPQYYEAFRTLALQIRIEFSKTKEFSS